MPPREELSSLLRRLRDTAGLTLEQAGERVGVGKSTVSRWESGKTVPTPEHAYQAAHKYGASLDDRERAHELADKMQGQYRRVVLTRSKAARFQHEIGEREQRSSLIRTFSPLLIPGLLQTEAYMRAVFGAGLEEEAVRDAVSARQSRQQLLGTDGHRFVQVLAYGALTWCAGDHLTMAAQLDHIVNVSHLPGVEVGVIPPRTPAHTFPLHAIDLYDQGAAVFGTATVTVTVESKRKDERADLELCTVMFEHAASLAVFGDQARGLLAAESHLYREDAQRGRP